jgi:hypothetical protein
MSGERLPTCSFIARARTDLGICYSNGKFSLKMGLAPETCIAMLNDLGLITTDDYEEDTLIPLNISLLWERTFSVSRRIRLCCCIKDFGCASSFLGLRRAVCDIDDGWRMDEEGYHGSLMSTYDRSFVGKFDRYWS